MDVDISYLDSKNWIEKDMLERFDWLRANDPVRWCEADQLWLVTKYKDVEYVSKHQEIFTSAEGVRPTMPARIGLIDEGEPRHGQLRKMLNKGFTPRMVTKLEETFRHLTKKALDAVAKEGQCDFVKSVSVPLPLWLIAAMIGIPEEDYDLFHEWSDAMISAEGNMDDPEITMKAGQAYVAYANYVMPIIEDRRKNPKDDLVSILANAKDEGLLENFADDARTTAISDEHMHFQSDEIMKLMVILLVAGNETTRNGISGGLQLLIENPEERRKLIENPGLMKTACEEMVRVASPVRSFSRTVLQDTELGGRQIKAGQRVLMIYPSANRDEDVFEEPNAFRVDRPAEQLGFGVGTHFCLGANLARMELRVVFEEVLRRMPDISYAGDGPVFQPSAIVRTCTEMRVKFTPEGQVADAA